MTPELFLNKALSRFFKVKVSYSQEGEDLLLSRIFEEKKSGFYVDVGAHHPKRFSNTFLFYQRGWRGINIDPLIAINSSFKKVRPRDINLGLGVSKTSQNLEYTMFNDGALNTFLPKRVDEILSLKEGRYHVVGKKEVPTAPLDKILMEHLPANQAIDFLSIDAEGLDLEVLSSNDWVQFRPSVVLFEDFNRDPGKSQSQEFLLKQGYRFFAKTMNTWFFVSDKFKI